MTPKVQTTKEKKSTNGTMWNSKVFANHTADKGLISKYIKHSTQWQKTQQSDLKNEN